MMRTDTDIAREKYGYDAITEYTSQQLTPVLLRALAVRLNDAAKSNAPWSAARVEALVECLRRDGIAVEVLVILLERPEHWDRDAPPECSICRRRHGREIEHACE